MSNDAYLTRADRLARLQVIIEEQKSLKQEYDQLRDQAVVPMTEQEIIVGFDGRKYAVSKVVGTTARYHSDRLHLLTSSQREAIVETKISGTRLKAATEDGTINPLLASRLVDFTDNQPYPKYVPIPD